MRIGLPQGLTRQGVVVSVLAPLFLAPLARPAAAQTTADHKWEIEVHGGGMLPTNPTGGTLTLPGPAEIVSLPGGRTTLRVPSWYFGDGTALFNQSRETMEAFLRRMQVGSPNLLAPIIPLDPLLGRSLGERRRGGSIGARISRALTARLTAELTVDYSAAPLQITQANSDAIEAARASVATAFDGLLRNGAVSPTLGVIGPFTQINVISTAALERGGGHQIFTSGALNINLRTTGTIIPYATVGAGLLATTGQSPTTTLTGSYRFAAPPLAGITPTFNGTDSVTLRDARDDRVAVAVLGGGLRYHVTPRWGIRIDARAHLGKNRTTTLVDASPGAEPPAVGLPNATWTYTFPPSPALVFGRQAASTLSAPISGLRTFAGNGIATHTNITAGVFWRF